MARIALVRPDILNISHSTLSMPMGPLYLAAAARAAGHEARLWDLNLCRPGRVRAALDELVAYRPDVVGFSTMTTQLPTLDTVSRHLRARLPGALFVVGGPAASSERGDLLEILPQIDVTVIGEGEAVLVALVDRFMRDGTFDGVPGTAYRRDGAPVVAPPAAPYADLDALPMPAWDLVDFDLHARFMTTTQHRHRHGVIFSSRGCPYPCTYCHSIFGRTFHAHSAGRVIEEVRILRHRHGVTRIEVFDDIFNFKRARAEEILSRVHAEMPDVKFGYPNGLRCDLIDEEFVRLLARTTYQMAIPVETVAERTNAVLKRGVNLDKVFKVAELTRTHGIYTWGYFIVGIPGETREEMALTFKAARELPIDLPVVMHLLPFKGTPLGELVASKGMALPDPMWSEYHRSTVNYSAAPAEYILEERARLWRETMILRPRNWHMVWSIATWIPWWLGPAELGVHAANVARTTVAYRLPADKLWAGDSFLTRKVAAIDRLARELDVAVPVSRRRAQPAA